MSTTGGLAPGSISACRCRPAGRQPDGDGRPYTWAERPVTRPPKRPAHQVSAEIEVRCLPSADRAFGALVAACVRVLEAEERLTPRALEAHVRRHHRLAVVRPQHPMARERDQPVVWYVYRDGTYVVDG